MASVSIQGHAMLAPSYLPEAKHALIADLADSLEPSALSWLSGYFAGVAQGRQSARPAPLAIAATAPALSAARLTILYGSQTGNAKRIAEGLLERCTGLGLDARLVRADQYPTRELKDEQLLYIVMSTQGDGEPPDDSIALVEFIKGRRAPKLPQLKYAVLGLGDSSYPSFCGISQQLDARLTELGAERLQEAGAADLDIETVASPWRDAALNHAKEQLKPANDTPASATVTPLRAQADKATREHPFQAELLLNQPITGRGSDKNIRHLEISLEGSTLAYEPGDALGIWPVQDEGLVEHIIQTLGLDGATRIEYQGAARSLQEWLVAHREVTVLTRPFLLAHAQRAQAPELDALLAPDARTELTELMGTSQVLDILRTWPAAWSASDLIATLRPLTPRMYSIASSPTAVDDEVHLTLANVAYQHGGEARWGVASRFLSQLEEGQRLPIFVEENTRFRLPADAARDIIMIGAGTGIAPYRAFIQARSASGASGRSWLFFGNPHFSSDFLYQTEWQQAVRAGDLTRIDLAFSRDQAEKIYVQHRLIEQGAELYDWVQAGAYLYVCGDATHMARDVHNALLEVARDQGSLDEDGARQWLDDLAAQGRYARDVY